MRRLYLLSALLLAASAAHGADPLDAPGAVAARDGLAQRRIGGEVVERLERDGLVENLAGGRD